MDRFRFQDLKELPPDSIFGLNQEYLQDRRPCKVNLGMGVYKTAELQPFIFKSVKKAEAYLLENEESKDYLSIDGFPPYLAHTKELVFGKSGELQNIYGAQTVGGTSALRIGANFLREMGFPFLYYSDPTWDNHRRIFHQAGFELATYPYLMKNTHTFDVEGFLSFLDTMAPHSVILLHGCCHNPTGIDPTFEEWGRIYEKMRERDHFPFFDLAYQGFGEGIEEDVRGVRYFVERGMPCLVAVSHSKNFGLYAERVGALYCSCPDLASVSKVASHMKMIIRGIYSNPPCHGAKIVERILSDSALREEWKRELGGIRERIDGMRNNLRMRLKKGGAGERFDYFAPMKGMFACLDLPLDQVKRLPSQFAIYLPPSGRINLAGLNDSNIDYVVQSILSLKVAAN